MIDVRLMARDAREYETQHSNVDLGPSADVDGYGGASHAALVGTRGVEEHVEGNGRQCLQVQYGICVWVCVVLVSLQCITSPFATPL